MHYEITKGIHKSNIERMWKKVRRLFPRISARILFATHFFASLSFFAGHNLHRGLAYLIPNELCIDRFDGWGVSDEALIDRGTPWVELPNLSFDFQMMPRRKIRAIFGTLRRQKCFILSSAK